MQEIFERRSIRKYTDQAIEKEDMKYLLSAAMAAPTAVNVQDWVFIVIDDKKQLQAISEFHPYASMLPSANKGILVCGDTKKAYGEMWVQDASAATQNILLAAQTKGIGSVWLGVYPMPTLIESFKELLELPEHITPFSMISLGYPNELKESVDRYDDSKIHYNKW